jgi:hypothetical protein
VRGAQTDVDRVDESDVRKIPPFPTLPPGVARMGMRAALPPCCAEPGWDLREPAIDDVVGRLLRERLPAMPLWPLPPWPPCAELVVNGPLIDDLFDRVKAGDAAALAKIRSMLPVDDPSGLRIEHRKAVLWRLRDRLRLGGLKDREIGTLLHKAGRHCEWRKDPLPSLRPFDRLDLPERRWIESEIRKLIALLPGDDWPSAETIRKL